MILHTSILETDIRVIENIKEIVEDERVAAWLRCATSEVGREVAASTIVG